MKRVQNNADEHFYSPISCPIACNQITDNKIDRLNKIKVTAHIRHEENIKYLLIDLTCTSQHPFCCSLTDNSLTENLNGVYAPVSHQIITTLLMDKESACKTALSL